MSTHLKHTKDEIFRSLTHSGYNKARIDRALHVYEKNYAIYDHTIIKEILYRLTVKDKVKQYQKLHKTIFESRSSLKQALFEMDLHDYYVDLAVKQYEVILILSAFIFEPQKILITIIHIFIFYLRLRFQICSKNIANML